MYPSTLDQTMAMDTSAYLPENATQMALTSNESTSFTSAESKDDAMRDTLRLTAVVLGVIITLGVIATVMTVTVLSSRSNFHEKTIGTEEGNVEGAASGVIVVAPDPKSKSTALTSKWAKSTTEDHTGHATGKPFTVPETTSVKSETTTFLRTPEKRKRDKSLGLLCTIGGKLSAPEILPESGLCHYLFCDSVYKKGFVPYDPVTVDPSLSIFVANRGAVAHTLTGVGFAYKYHQQLLLQLLESDEVPSKKILRNENICNFGILDTPTNGFDEISLHKILQIFGFLHEATMLWKTEDETCVTVFTAPPGVNTLEDLYVDYFSHFFKPDIIVIRSHYLEGDNTFEDCRVVPPTMLKMPPLLTTNSSYTDDMSTAAETIKRLVERGVDTQWALSVTMKGRWNTLKPGQPAAFLSECVYDPSAESFGSYSEVCNDPSFRNGTTYKTGAYGPLYYNQSDGRTFTFENVTTLVDKLCRVGLQYWPYSFGIAVYDVDYEDISKACPSSFKETFERVLHTRLLVDYFKHSFYGQYTLNACLENNG
ncbi:uncharacterized protein LOC142767196 [Rhipicephalus microplus]|uniref:uncharacterized protein LOC142767196 n=1 Tax=Rhipicephalus microplus TaxID=6941 RepID=UPI003F6D8217